VPEAKPNRLIIGISGASGTVYGIRLLQVLRKTPTETHLVISRAAEIASAHETHRKLAEVKATADVRYAVSDIGAAISSGSFRTEGMIVAPCSIRSMLEIATGVTSTLLTRAADVVLKERRRHPRLRFSVPPKSWMPTVVGMTVTRKTSGRRYGYSPILISAPRIRAWRNCRANSTAAPPSHTAFSANAATR
jgi:hypothetical protein